MATAISILSLFGLGFDLEAQIQDILDRVLTTPDRIELIDNLISDIEDLNDAIAAEQSSPNNALIKADVLEWQGYGTRTAGAIALRLELLTRLSNLLGLEKEGIVWRKTLKTNFNTGFVV